MTLQGIEDDLSYMPAANCPFGVVRSQADDRGRTDARDTNDGSGTSTNANGYARQLGTHLVQRLALLGVAVVVLAAGCSVGPVGPGAADQERAFQITWEGIAGMEMASRPHVVWYDAGDCQSVPVDGVTIHVPGACEDADVDSHGNVLVAWHGGDRISDTGFATGLADWRLLLMTGSFDLRPEWYTDQQRFNGALRGEGL